MAQNRAVNVAAANVHVGAALGAVAAGGAGAQPAQAYVRAAVMPEAFDGSDDWAEYLQYFDQCAVVNGWGDAQKAQFLAARLRGAAQRFFASIPLARTWSGSLQLSLIFCCG